MPSTSVSAILSYLHRVHRLHEGREATDGELLTRFARERDGNAFAALVERHGPMVFGVCRRVLANTQDAEDAFQATFLVLARKAGGIRTPDLLGNWLYGVASRTAAKARVRAARRRLREHAMPDLTAAVAPAEAGWDDLRPVLDEEIARLPTRYRVPFVLCYVEGLTNAEAARRIGVPKGTVLSRLAWARQRLRTRLARRGVVVSAGLLAVLISQRLASAAVPFALADLTVQSAVPWITGAATGGLVSAPVAALTRGVLQAMFLHKVKIATALAFALLVFGAGATFALRASLGAREPEPALPDAAPRVAVLQDEKKPDKEAEKTHEKKHHDVKYETVKETVTKSFTVGRTPTMVVETFNGGIKVTTADDGKVEVQVVKRGSGPTKEDAQEAMKNVDVKMTQEGDTIRVTAKKIEEQKQEHNRGSGATAELRVPAGAVLDLDASNGPITVVGGSGAVKAHTSNGPVKLEEHRGTAEVATSNGKVTATGVGGRVHLKTSNGSIEVRAEKAELTASTSNGTIHFQGTLADGKHVLHTSNGSVVVTVPAGVAMEVNGSTSLGRVHSDFESQDESGRRRGRQHLHVRTGDNPKITVDIQTSNGNIDVRRAS
jgi:RNA polymerase sigma factor (sigma-70 family)